MRFPLLVAARPRVAKEGPCVPLPSGRWHIICERFQSSILEMFIDGVLSPTLLDAQTDGHYVEGPCVIVLIFKERGLEDYIHVFAETA